MVYLGSSEALLARQLTRYPDGPANDRRAVTWWPPIEEALDDDPIILTLSSVNRTSFTTPGRLIAPGVRLVTGPDPTGDVTPSDFSPTPLGLGVLSVAALALLAVAGSGWSRALVPGPLVDRLALAPAFGLAGFVLIGMVLDAAGVNPGGTAGVLAPALTTGLGWLPIGRLLHRSTASAA
jgi:hypothetical protein